MLSRLVDARVDPRPLAVARVLVGLAAMVMAFDSRSLLRRIAAPGTLRLPTASWLPEPSLAVADVVLVALLVAGAALAAGVLARLAAACCAVLAVLPMAIDHQAYSNHGVLLAALGVLLALAEPAAALSPKVRWRPAPRTIAYWPVLLMKVQVSTLYGWAAIAKLNESYLTDETLRIATAGWAREVIPGGGFRVAAVVVLLAEAFLAVALWWRRTRPAAYVVGLVLHGGLVLFGWAPLGLVPFAVLTLAPYLLFLQDPLWGQGGLPSDLAAQLLPSRTGPPRTSTEPMPASATPTAKNDQL